MGLIDSGIEGLATLILAAADAEFRTPMGLANFVLTLIVFASYVTRVPMLRFWNLMMWGLERLAGSSPEPPQPVPQLPPLPRMLLYTLGGFVACVVTVSVTTA